jgi:Flp pilus assembly protein TadD
MLNKLSKDGRQWSEEVETLYELATTALNQGAWEEAQAGMKRVLDCAPDHQGANRVLAAIAGHLGNTTDAILLWRRVVTLSGGEDLEALTQLGIALSLDGQHDQATQLLADVADRRTDVGSAQADLGMALLAAQRLEEALAAFQRACDLDPRSPQAHCGMGLVYQQLGRWWEAADCFRATEQLAPTSAVGPMNLAMVLDTLGEHRQAREALQRAAALAPHDEEIRRALAASDTPEEDDEVTRPALREQLGASITGDLATFTLLDVLEFLRIQSKTGVLTVSSASGTGSVRLVAGRLAGARILGAPSLADAVAAAGLASGVDATDDDEFLLLRLWQDESIRGQLGPVVLGQIMAALARLLDWPAGAFSFHGLDAADTPPLSFDVQEVTLRLATLKDGIQAPAPS